jgi:carotenoid 1,2-hydratase
MTERGRDALQRERNWLAIGPSSLTWDGDALTIRLDEITAPLPSKLRGTVRVQPTPLIDYTLALDDKGLHRWSPIAASARIEVTLDRPEISWTGRGYFDSNSGDAPLEDDFTSWTWSRAAIGDGTAILYDVLRRDGSTLSASILTDSDGSVRDIEQPPQASLPHTLWRLPQMTRADAGYSPKILQRLEDAPFYSRSVLSTQLLGRQTTAVHESLSLDRFVTPWTQFCLPFRMPRAFKRARAAPTVRTDR